MESLDGQVGLFFTVGRQILIYACPLARAGRYGDFLNYPLSHDAVWEKTLRLRYNVDFDYYPRGRIVYNVPNDRYTIYHDRCCEKAARLIGGRYPYAKVAYALDEHYQCRSCNPLYCE